VPLYRLQGYQAMLGVPVPDSTQWDQIEQVCDCSYKLFAYLDRIVKCIIPVPEVSMTQG
jgi:hypothetical protein